MQNRIVLTLFVLAIILISHWTGQQAYQWLPIAAAQEAEPIGDLFSFLVTLGTIIFLGVTGMLTYSLLFYRAQRGEEGDGPAIRGNNKLEIIWTVIPILLVTWIAVYSFDVYQRMNVLGYLPIVHLPTLEIPAIAQEARENLTNNLSENTIEVNAKQWAWSFYYPEQKVTSHELHLPVNQRIKLLMTSEDVLHGFYVPNFRIKQDIVPNRTIELKFTPNRIGEYQLQDSQFSGTYFALMQAKVLVEEKTAYQQWLNQAANQEKKPAKNAAKQEHEQSIATTLRSHWHTVKPSEPPLVNSP